MNLFITSLFAFLPKQYRATLLRGGEVSRGAAVASGMEEFFIVMVLLAHHYLAYANHWLASVPDAVVFGGYSADGEVGMMGLGTFMLIGFVLQPLTIVLLYFLAEGAVRATAAVVSGEIRGSLPFWLVAFLRTKAEAWREEAKLGPRIADEVERFGEQSRELRIASCRPKLDWDERVTISYQQGLYEVSGEEAGEGPRPFVYRLRPKPEFKVIRALRHYAPDEVLKGND